MPLFVEPALREILRTGPAKPDEPASFTFIDLFAGIGGMRFGFETAGGAALLPASGIRGHRNLSEKLWERGTSDSEKSHRCDTEGTRDQAQTVLEH